MKHRIAPPLYALLLSLALLAACTKTNAPEPDPQANATAAPAPSPEKKGLPSEIALARALLAHSAGEYEPKVLAAAATLANAGEPLSSATAEHCWQEEARRPMVQAACALLWATGGEKSDLLDGALAAGSGASRPLALAAVRKGTPLQQISSSALPSLFDQLAPDAPWVRARAAQIWLSAHPGTEAAEADSLLARLPLTESASPVSLARIYRAAMQAREARGAETLGGYCRPAVGGVARLRCWRFLGALAGDPAAGGLNPAWISFLPAARDQDWTLFERTFPEHAHLLLPSMNR